MSEESLKSKTELAEVVFNTLCKAIGTGRMDYLVKLTIDTTNSIFEGIQQ